MSVVTRQIGVSTNICPYSINLLDAVTNLSRHFSIIEIELENQIRYFFESDKSAFSEEIKKLLQLKNKKRLNFCLHAPYIGSETDLSAINPAIRQEAIWRMMELIELAVDLGCENVTYYLHGLHQKFDQQILFNNLQCSLAKLALYAEKLNIKILLEYVPTQLDYQSEIGFAQICSLCSKFNFKMALNVTQNAIVYDNNKLYENVLRNLLPYLGKIYIANTLSVGHNIKNNAYYQKLLSYLYANDFNGSIIIERKNHLSGFGQDDNQLLLATEKLKNLLQIRDC